MQDAPNSVTLTFSQIECTDKKLSPIGHQGDIQNACFGKNEVRGNHFVLTKLTTSELEC